MGAGDGRFVVETARADPCTFAVAVDPDHRALRDGVRRAQRVRLANTLFVISGFDSLPDGIAGIADAVHVHFPWGSLREAFLHCDASSVGRLPLLVRAGGTLTVLLNDTCVTPSINGLELVDARAATDGEVAASRSTWAKRLGVGSDRPAWRLEFRR